ncbi:MULTISPECIES: DUF6361 family protein [Mycobacterium]|uniref:Uncharacterized protein n=1 Tax=Mycobacterium colombiense TaxID=339268 RepID=A0A329LVP1_9MYCO|nr:MULTISPECIES: DUF6361 family protein [Mycobacterium]MDM4141395.1 DUF6361 family protein [Mycobacterium sp. FLAC0960]RAV11206.1 hypothetical protein DQP57_12100 [Mycobacterium colombiense]
MTALIAWLDASSEDQRRMREIVNLFSERESRDELGIGQVRDALSDALWPGTSTLFTRARYFLFIPWCFRAAAEARNDIDRAAALADRNERQLIAALRAANETEGVIGGNVGMAVKNLPSALYWGGMRTHGILNDPTMSRDDAIAAEVDRVHSRRPVAVEYQDDVAAWHGGGFHPTLPSVPDGFPTEVPTGFAMSFSEAAWLRDRMLASSPDTLLEFALEHRPDANSDVPWEDSVLKSAEGERASVLDDARRFSILMNSAALMYNLLLAEAYEREGFDRVESPVDEYRGRLDRWAEQPNLERDISTWDRAAFWCRVLERNPNVNPRSRRFIDDWLDLLNTVSLSDLANNESLRTFIIRREREHKRTQARLTNKRLLQAWLGASGSRALVYRWTQMRPVLHDIHDGLERADA